MIEQAQPNPRLQREKALFRYSSALQRADFAAIAGILNQAGEDRQLETMLLELNVAYQEELARLFSPALNKPTILQSIKELWQQLTHQPSTAPDHKQSGQPRRVGIRPALAGGLFVTLILAFFVVRILGSTIMPMNLSLVTSTAVVEAPYQQPAAPTEAAAATAVPPDDYAKKVPRLPAIVQQPAAQPTSAPAQPAPTAVPPDQSGNRALQGATPRMIVYSGNLVLIVNDTRQAEKAIDRLVGEMASQGSFIVSRNDYSDTGNEQPVIDIVLRVPVDRFNESMDRIAALSTRILNRNQSAEDITADYVDVSARVAELQAAVQRLTTIMENAKTTADLLAAERELTQRQADLDALKGRMQYLAQSAQLSSINVELRPSVLNQPVTQVGWQPAETVNLAYKALVNSLQGAANFVITFAIAILPWLLLAALIVYAIVRIVLRRGVASKSHLHSSD